MKTKMLKQIGVRVDEPTELLLKSFQEQTGVPPSLLARQALLGALEYWQKNGLISFPLHVEPKNNYKKNKS